MASNTQTQGVADSKESEDNDNSEREDNGQDGDDSDEDDVVGGLRQVCQQHDDDQQAAEGDRSSLDDSVSNVIPASRIRKHY